MSEQLTEKTRLYNWQKKLLPFLIGLPSILVIVFIVLATNQISQFNNSLKEENAADSAIIKKNLVQESRFPNDAEYAKWITLVNMEQESLKRRYKQAGFLLMSRVLTKYLGFFTGMILAIVGAAFVVGKLSEESTTVDASIAEQVKFNVASTSPGIIFGLLGSILMVTTILIKSEINVQDQPMYLNANTIQVTNHPVKTNGPAVPSGMIDPSMLDSLDKVTNH